MTTDTYVPVVRSDAIDEDGFDCFQIDDLAIVICRRNDEYFAVENQCSHALSTFDGGFTRGYRLICPLHGAAFDFRDGSAAALPATRPIRTFPTRVQNGMVEIDVGER